MRARRCWLAKECDRPNACAVDRDIAAALQAASRARNRFAQTTSLWVTVQGRVVCVVYVEGCTRSDSPSAEIETFVRALPQVQQAIAILRIDVSARLPYRVRGAP